MCFSKLLTTSTMLVLFALLILLSCGVRSVHCVHENSADLHALLDFKKGVISDPNGALSSWNSSIHYCRWMYVTCTKRRPWRVSGLNLTGQSLSGSITTSLGNLTSLDTLDLSVNSFSGQIPLLQHLQQLQNLLLRSNSLTGVIPDTLTNCSNLQTLDLSENMLEGAIPQKIGLLSNLQSLNLGSNNLNGTIPSTLKNIIDLRFLYLYQNNLEGSIPDELWQLPVMTALYLYENKLSGTLPSALPNQTSLGVLDLHSNLLSKELPSNIGDALSSLQALDIHRNKFEGHIPASLGNAANLDTIDLSENYFTGQIPVAFGKLQELTYLNLQENKLGAEDKENWEFLETLSNCKLLDTLTLFNNQLQGVVPDSLGKLPKSLGILNLSTNNLSGPLPSSIGNLVGLYNLDLSNNNFNGSIEEWAGRLTNLEGLNLHANNFIGLIPPSIGNLRKLTNLSLSQNGFEGPIPPSIGNLPILQHLNLSHNKLKGKIPVYVFSATTMTTCALSYNNLDGTIPSEVSNLKQLTELHLSSNKLSGEIPVSIGECQDLQTVKIDNNLLTGNIPKSFGKIKSLVLLNLSHNNLSGSIPTELGNLQLLTQLDLSYNHLEGDVPCGGVFKNASAVVSLNDNLDLCGGESYLQMPPCPRVHQRARTQYYLIRVLIPIFGFMSLILLIYLIIVEKKNPRRRHMGSLSLCEQFPKVSYEDLVQATGNFSESNLVGRGNYGSVYRGKLIPSKLEVAVKVLDLEMRGAERSFLAECEAMRGIQHRNLLDIITVCSTLDTQGNPFKALIYEYMPNGNLDTWLHHNGDGKDAKNLSLSQRISIAVNIADALEYLHHHTGRPIVHCDVKPSNILLDTDMIAHLGDFGIARFYLDSNLPAAQDSRTIGLKGTIGYIAPEYAESHRPSTCGDVYSFGVLLLEMSTGKRPTDPMFTDGVDIVSFVQKYYPEQILQATDASLQEEYTACTQAKILPENAVHRCLTSLVQVGLSCTRKSPSDRINMSEVAAKMHEIQATYGWFKK